MLCDTTKSIDRAQPAKYIEEWPSVDGLHPKVPARIYRFSNGHQLYGFNTKKDSEKDHGLQVLDGFKRDFHRNPRLPHHDYQAFLSYIFKHSLDTIKKSLRPFQDFETHIYLTSPRNRDQNTQNALREMVIRAATPLLNKRPTLQMCLSEGICLSMLVKGREFKHNLVLDLGGLTLDISITSQIVDSLSKHIYEHPLDRSIPLGTVLLDDELATFLKPKLAEEWNDVQAQKRELRQILDGTAWKKLRAEYVEDNIVQEYSFLGPKSRICPTITKVYCSLPYILWICY
jgi:hypothetical protein